MVKKIVNPILVYNDSYVVYTDRLCAHFQRSFSSLLPSFPMSCIHSHRESILETTNLVHRKVLQYMWLTVKKIVHKALLYVREIKIITERLLNRTTDIVRTGSCLAKRWQSTINSATKRPYRNPSRVRGLDSQLGCYYFPFSRV